MFVKAQEAVALQWETLAKGSWMLAGLQPKKIGLRVFDWEPLKGV